MKRKRQKRVIAIQTTTAEEFNAAINAELSARESPEITFITSVPFTAYVSYEEVTEVPETLAEAYELRGDARTCQECPYFLRNEDKRYKWHYCTLKQRKVTAGAGACETYYHILEELIKEAAK